MKIKYEAKAEMISLEDLQKSLNVFETEDFKITAKKTATRIISVTADFDEEEMLWAKSNEAKKEIKKIINKKIKNGDFGNNPFDLSYKVYSIKNIKAIEV